MTGGSAGVAARVLKLEWQRGHAAVANVLAGQHAGDRAAAVRGLVLLASLAVGGVWIAGRLADPQPGDPGPGAAETGLTVAAFLGLMLFVDGVRRGAGLLESAWNRRFEAEWLPAAGVPPLGVGCRATARTALAAAGFAWVPLLGLAPALPRLAAGAALAGVAAGLSASLAGAAAGRAGRVLGRAYTVALTLACAAWGALLLLRLVPAPELPEALRAVHGVRAAVWPWHLALRPRGGGWEMLAVTCASLCAALAVHTWAAARAGWDSPGREAPPRARGANGMAAARSPFLALLRSDAHRLGAWARTDVLVLLWIFPPTAAMYAALLWAPAELRQAVSSMSVLPWAALYALSWPSLACAEAMWGREPRAVWEWHRVARADLGLPLRARLAALGAALGGWHLLLSVLLAFSLGARAALDHAALGAAALAGGLALHAAAAALGVRGDFAGGASGRLLRYAALVAGSAAPVVVLAATGSLPLACSAAAAIALVGIAAGQALLRGAEFLSHAVP
jgi:hypothetical protein